MASKGDDDDFEDDLVSFEDDIEDDSVFNQTIMSENATFESAFESESDIDDPAAMSTPKKKGKGKKNSAKSKSTPRRGKNNDVFKKPAAPPVIFGRCPTCKKGLKTETGYKKHVQAHKWKELATKMPPTDYIVTHCMTESAQLLQKIEDACKYGSKWCPDFMSYLCSLKCQVDSKCWEDFIKFLCARFIVSFFKARFSKGVLLPSSARENMQRHISSVMSDEEFRNEALAKLNSCAVSPVSVASSLLFELSYKLCDLALINVFRVLCGPVSSVRRRVDDFQSVKSQQVVYHVAGSALRRFVKQSYNNPRCQYYTRIKLCILSNFGRIGAPTSVQANDKSYWTSVLCRKSQFFCNDNSYPFFLAIFKLLQSLESPGQGVMHEKVMEHVCKTQEIMNLWDSIVGSSLNEDESFSFMVKLIRKLTNTYGRGLLLRGMNQRARSKLAIKATTSVSHRARLL